MSRSRVFAFGGVAAVAVGIVVAVTNAFATAGSATPTPAVLAAKVTPITRSVSVGGATVHVTQKPGGTVCYDAPGLSSCASSLADSQLSYATGRVGGKLVLGGVAGAKVTAVIARLTRRGTVWPELHGGAFYTVLPHGLRLRTIVKVLADGRRIAFAA
jgi:hypothetical protein